MILLDTDVMVDIMRRYPPALAWLKTLADETVGIPDLVAMELIQGCRDRKEQTRVEVVLRRYVLYWPDQIDCERAFEDYLSYHLSHGLGILDALIAETAVGRGARLATFNTKHYAAFAGIF